MFGRGGRGGVKKGSKSNFASLGPRGRKHEPSHPPPSLVSSPSLSLFVPLTISHTHLPTCSCYRMRFNMIDVMRRREHSPEPPPLPASRASSLGEFAATIGSSTLRLAVRIQGERSCYPAWQSESNDADHASRSQARVVF